jgi:hypothetical protein
VEGRALVRGDREGLIVQATMRPGVIAGSWDLKGGLKGKIQLAKFSWPNSVEINVGWLGCCALALARESILLTCSGEIMGTLARMVCIGGLSLSIGWGAVALGAAPEHPKNWTPPAKRIYAQKLADEIMAAHPELISVTFHGVPPGQTDTYTMFAGSFPDRIGNADDPDDIDISKKGITIVDPRWHRPNDTVKKFVMMLPLRDSSDENVGEIVLAYKNPPDSGKSEKDFFLAATALRDGLKKKIHSYSALFEPAE